MENIFPEQSHWCVLLNIQGNLCALVCLYNTFERHMVIAKNRGGDIPLPDGMVCDWKNNKESRLVDYIAHMNPAVL